MKNYLQKHLHSVYLPTATHLPGLVRYENRYGWQDYYIGDKILFSHRKTVYDFAGFPEKLHSHSFYEMDIYVSGNDLILGAPQSYTAGNANVYDL